MENVYTQIYSLKVIMTKLILDQINYKKGFKHSIIYNK